MLPRLKIIQCFQCEYNLECWGFLENTPLGKNERELYIDHDKLIEHINKFPKGEEGLNVAEYYGMISALFMNVLKHDHDVKRRDVYQLISFLCAICNTDNDSWVCPAENSLDADNFNYVPRG